MWEWIRSWMLVGMLGLGGMLVSVCLPLDEPTLVRPAAVGQVRRLGARWITVCSWYGHPFHGRKTASGEVFDQNRLTAAHLWLPLGTKVRVTNLSNGRMVVVRINDRGPYVAGRGIDLSRAAAAEIGLLNQGISRVAVELLP